MNFKVLFSLKGLAARYPLGSSPGNPWRPFAFKNIGVGWRVGYFDSSLMSILGHAIDSVGGGCRPLQNECVAMRVRSRGLRRGFNTQEVAGGSESPRAELRQAPLLLPNCCRSTSVGSLKDESVLFNLSMKVLLLSLQ